MQQYDAGKDGINYDEFKKAFYGEGMTYDKAIDYLWKLRLGHQAFSDNFKTKEELIQAIRGFREFIFQLLYNEF
ncbi:MAG: hypothetical protein US76_02885 [Parcubacteria group bacterium GW2011_GWA2_38_13b]|nr:MAG: hypothetical protein US76_02885 [Parcubacteria group bacterium GW2011_GWA2_38_13b]